MPERKFNVHVVADAPAKLARITASVAKEYAVTAELLRDAGGGRKECDVLILDVDLSNVANIAAVRKIIRNDDDNTIRVFLLDQRARLPVSQAYALGASRVLVGPEYRSRLLAVLKSYAGSSGAPSSTDKSLDNDAVSFGATTIASMFAAVANGSPIDLIAINDAGSKIADRIAQDGLSDWLATVRHHHEGTYQHCLLVTGVAIDFALSLGMARSDVQRLYSAAMLHDIGKATIPLTILDKAGRLDPQERAIMEAHSAASFDLLKCNSDISPEILDAVRHHHEYLDGSGYPDGLRGDRINDIVRLLTIADIFSALIEDRRYKPPMPREEAYGILCQMDGKLEKALVAAFKSVALDR